MGSYDECKGYPVYTLKIIMLRVGVSGAYRTFSTSGACRKYFNQHTVTPTIYMVQLSATMEQTHETQLVLDFRRVIARYDVVSSRYETGPWSICTVDPMIWFIGSKSTSQRFWEYYRLVSLLLLSDLTNNENNHITITQNYQHLIYVTIIFIQHIHTHYA